MKKSNLRDTASRLNVLIDPQTAAILDELRETHGLRSASDAVRSALRLYKLIRDFERDEKYLAVWDWESKCYVRIIVV